MLVESDNSTRSRQGTVCLNGDTAPSIIFDIRAKPGFLDSRLPWMLYYRQPEKARQAGRAAVPEVSEYAVYEEAKAAALKYWRADAAVLFPKTTQPDSAMTSKPGVNEHSNLEERVALLETALQHARVLVPYGWEARDTFNLNESTKLILRKLSYAIFAYDRAKAEKAQ